MGYKYFLDRGQISGLGLKTDMASKTLAKSTRLASGALVRDVIATKRTWSFAWDYLPGNNLDVDDGGLGRDMIKELFDSGGEHTLTYPVEGQANGIATVMFGEDYKESIQSAADEFLWKVSFTLVEI